MSLKLTSMSITEEQAASVQRYLDPLSAGGALDLKVIMMGRSDVGDRVVSKLNGGPRPPPYDPNGSEDFKMLAHVTGKLVMFDGTWVSEDTILLPGYTMLVPHLLRIYENCILVYDATSRDSFHVAQRCYEAFGSPCSSAGPADESAQEWTGRTTSPFAGALFVIAQEDDKQEQEVTSEDGQEFSDSI